jgi:spore coat protein U-like protein
MRLDDTSGRGTIRRLLLAAVVGAAVPCALSADLPYTATAVLPVVLQIVGTCNVRASDLSFGAYATGAGTPLGGQTTLVLECTAGFAVEVGLDAGQGAGATVQDRRMMSGTDSLRYGLYQDAARLQVWGDTSGIDTVPMNGTGAPQSVTIYGQVPANQQVPAGTYSDVITVRVYF